MWQPYTVTITCGGAYGTHVTSYLLSKLWLGTEHPHDNRYSSRDALWFLLDSCAYRQIKIKTS